MAVTVGTDVYISVADADTYWSERNNTTWSAADTATKEKALREATQYIDGTYDFIGFQNTNNLLAFPRNAVIIETGNFSGVSYDDATIPPQVEDACAELALEGLSARLNPSLERGGAIKKEKVDVLEVEYADFAPSAKSYDFVTKILKPLLSGGQGQKTLVRA